MSGDITLDGDWVTIDGRWTRVRTWDLMLDAQDRRSSQSGMRRALVHNKQDGLTINYGADYPGGVTIKGKTKVESIEADDLSCNGIKTKGVSCDATKTNQVQVGQFRLAQSALNSLTLGDSTATDVIELQGPGLRIVGRLEVYKDAVFQEPMRSPDVTITPVRPGGNAGDDPRYDPFSLVAKLGDLQDELEVLRNKVKDLEQRVANP